MIRFSISLSGQEKTVEFGRHPNDPEAERTSIFALPALRLTPVYRLEAALAAPIDLGETGQGRRRIVPLTGGTFTGPQTRGTLLPGASADWQTVLPGGTALDWLNKGVFTSVAVRQATGVVYETYLVE